MHSTQRVSFFLTGLFLSLTGSSAAGADTVPDPSHVKTVRVLLVPEYSEGVVFDHDGHAYISHGKSITKFSTDGQHQIWAETGAPNGHKILADGTHLVCDRTHQAVLHMAADATLLEHASTGVDGQPLRGPNDLSLDTPNGGFYFTDPHGSSRDEPIGTVYYVDRDGNTHRIDDGLAFPNGIVLRPNGKSLLVAESQKNRILHYDVVGPGKIASRKVFATLPAKDPNLDQVDDQPDGMCLDAQGNLYIAHHGMKQVQVLNPSGELIARFDGGAQMTSNVAFGGPGMDQLFITGSLTPGGQGAVFRIDLGVPGLVILPRP